MMKDILTTYDVSKYCHVSLTTVVNWIKDGSLKAYRTKGGHRRITKNDLLEFLQKNEMPISLKKNILVVDDDKAIQTGLKKLFESKGYEVELAGNGFEAGILIEMKKPALVVLDLVMPGLDGFWVCEYIKKIEALKNMKIIVLTGHATKENIKKAKAAGANRVIEKPVDNKIIIKEVEDLLGLSFAHL
ncbi:MAG: response regulator [bacterium]